MYISLTVLVVIVIILLAFALLRGRI